MCGSDLVAVILTPIIIISTIILYPRFSKKFKNSKIEVVKN